MNLKTQLQETDEPRQALSKKEYKQKLYQLQIELVKLQRQIIKSDDKILVILEGRDSAGKDGAIKRINQHLSPREIRVVALGKPSDRDRGAWYFQRYVPHLPVAQELVLFNRSWYNRAGVELVMGFCTADEHEEFMTSVLSFEHLLVHSGIKVIKYYLDISHAEQKKRLENRATDPLKQWKTSPIDAQAIKYWEQYSAARNEMLARSHAPLAPWTIVHTDNKHEARLNIISDLLGRLDYKGKDKQLPEPDSRILFTYDAMCLKEGRLAP